MTTRRRIALILMGSFFSTMPVGMTTFLASAIAGPSSEIATIGGVSSPGGTNTANAREITVFFATDRNHKGSYEKRDDDGIKTVDEFGSKSSDLKYGTCTVSIPSDHQIGEIETRPFWKPASVDDYKNYVDLRESRIQSAEDFFSKLKKGLSDHGENNAFIFIHGYNVTFENAAKRTAQIAYDLDFKGAPIFYSWPSKGWHFLYWIDEKTVKNKETLDHLEQFLTEFFNQSKAENVYLIAHSMGNRPLAQVIPSWISKNPKQKSRLKQIILAAPDIDAEVFIDEIAPQLVKSGQPVTLYAASNDFALTLSKWLHSSPRIGGAGSKRGFQPNVKVIDATNVNTDQMGLNHSYFAEKRSVLSDLFYLVHKDLGTEERFGLRKVDEQDNQYWMFEK